MRPGLSCPAMAIYPIRTFGDPVLRTVASPVVEIDDKLRRLVDDMIETMYDAPGVGLAAPQIGISRRVIVFDAGEGPRVMINPELIEVGSDDELPEAGFDREEVDEVEEGCLSVPGYWWHITRPAFAWARGIGLDGEPVEYWGTDLMGRVLQHEVDHLNGTLLLERLDRKTRKAALRDLRNEALGFA